MSKLDMKALSEKLQAAINSMATDDRTFAKQEKEMLAYMYEKYGIELQVDWSARTIYKDSYDSWNCSPKGTTEEAEQGKIEVHRWRNRKKDPYADTYYPTFIREEVEKRVHKAFEGHIEPCKVYVEAESRFVDNKYHSIEQIDQYIEEKKASVAGYHVAVLVPDYGDEKRNEELEQKIIERLKAANVSNCYYNILYMNESVYEKMTRKDLDGLHMRRRENKELYNKHVRREIYSKEEKEAMKDGING